VSQTLLKIYRTGGAPIVISTQGNGFVFAPAPVGKVTGIFRVDFYDQPGEGVTQILRAVVPCDPAFGEIDFADTFVHLGNLRFIYVFGQPDLSADELGLSGQLEFQNGDPARLGFVAGLSVDNQRVAGSTFPFMSYAETISMLTTTGVAAGIAPAPLPGAGSGWEHFTFGDQLFYAIRKLDAGVSGSARLPLLTPARAIPAITGDKTGIRRLPGPFAIPVDLPSDPNFPDSVILAAADPVNSEFLNGTGPATGWQIQITSFNPGTIAEFWQHHVFERYVGALESVESGEPVSLLPRFVPPADGAPVSAADSDWMLRLPAQSSPAAMFPSGPGSLAPAFATTQVSIQCDGFKAFDGNGIKAAVILANPDSSLLPSDVAYVAFTATAAPGARPPGKIRIGSLDLTPSGAPVFPLCIARFDAQPLFDNFWVPRIGITNGSMALGDAQPGGQDDPADPVAAQVAEAVAATGESQEFLNFFQRAEPFVISVASSTGQGFKLGWQEGSVAGFNQSLTLSLTATSPGTGAIDVLVIDPQPFTVARVQLPGLASAASAATSEVAQWSNSFPEGPSWRIAAGAGKYTIVLPPQGVGEQMVKGPIDQTPPKPMQFRLTPPMVAALQSDTQLQRFAEPGWNTRRGFGFPGERAPGALVQSIAVEFLYGMLFSVTQQGLRMSEMFSRLGAFAGPLLDSATGQLKLHSGRDYSQDQRTYFDTLNQQWAAIYSQLLSRLGVLELWEDEAQHELLLSTGVSCTLRRTAQLAYPVGTQGNNSYAPPQPRDGGLQGGVAWPFDSANVYEDFWKNPNSTSALLANPRFTALGGSGKQRAAFSNGNIIVESEISIGSLVSVTVILRGYIGNLRHPAKHVVVYSRSVRPSRQFYGEQPALEGRPILRKTSEYVEMTQKDRSYPEAGDPNAATGPLLGAEFKTVRINVDSAWGGDHGKGWRVPLWRRDATPADVYPRPQILLELAIDPAKGAASRKCEMLDPDKLYFYTDPSQTVPSTDEWPLVEFVDFCNTDRFRSIDHPSITDYTREPGFGQFTYTVDGDAPEINVVAQRTKNAMSSRLTNVTFMRGNPNPLASKPGQASAGRLPDHLHNTIDELGNAARATSQGVVITAAQALQARAAAAALPQQIRTILDQVVTAAQAAPQGAALTVKQALAVRLAGLSDIVTVYGNDITAVQGLQGALCDTLANAAASLVDRAGLALSAEWDNLESTVQSSLSNILNPTSNFPEVLKQTLLARIDGLFAGLQSALSPLIADVSAVASVATDLQSFTAAAQQGLRNLVNDISAANLALPQFPARCVAIVQRCQADVSLALDDVRQVLQVLGLIVGVSASQTASEQIDALQSAVDSVATNLATGFQAVINALNATQPVVQTITDAINAVVKALTDAVTGIPAVTAALGIVQNALGAIGSPNAFNATLASLRDELRTAVTNLADNATADAYQAAINAVLAAFSFPSFSSQISAVRTAVQQQARALCNSVAGTVAAAAGQIAGLLSGALPADLPQQIANLAASVGLDDAVKAIEDFRNANAGTIDDVVQQCRSLLGANDLAASADSAISVLRAFGAPPIAPSLGFSLPPVGCFSLPSIGYFFDGAQAVAVSNGLKAAAAEVSAIAKGADALSQLGITLPTSGLLDRLIPADLTNLNISDLLPHIAGLDLATLFSGVGIPASARDNIHISHQLDPQTLKASVDIALNFSLAQEATLFSIGPATITLDRCNFQATIHIEGAPGQAASHTSQGSITGDWNVEIGGLGIVTFVSTALTFDGAGHLHFDISPERVELNGALEFLAGFLQQTGLGGKGFSLNLLPAGVQCILDLPFPDCSFGAFGITNLRLGALFSLAFGDGLDITVGANLGRKTAPFTLTIFILGGAGWFEAGLTYHTKTGQLTADVSIGILASASLSISLGPISGGVYIYFGITTEFHSGTGRGGLTVGILLMIEGRVSLLGFIDVDIMLLLEAEYTSGGGLVGRGQITLSIKICWCFTLNVSASVEYTFGNASGSQSRSTAAVHKAEALSLAPRAPTPPSLADYAQAAANRINFLS